MAGRPIMRGDTRPTDKEEFNLTRYNNITSSILNNNSGGADIEELFINSARDGAYHKLKSLISSCNDSYSSLNINVRDKRTGNTALIWACKRGHVKVVQLVLAHGADITLQNHNRESALEVASPLIKQIILDCVDHGDALYSQRLLHAAWVGNHNIVNDILSCGRTIDVDIRNTDGFTPLLLCTRDVYTLEKLGSQLLKNYQPTAIVNDFIQCGADTSARDSEGKTALHYCASSKASKALPLTALLSKNAEIDAKDRQSLTPLHYACQAGNLAIAKLLVEYGANVNSKGFGGTTPLHIAAFNNLQQLAVLLLEHGANSQAVDDKGQTPVDVARNRKFKLLLKSWSASEVTTTPEQLAPVKVTNLASTIQLEDGKLTSQKSAGGTSKENNYSKSFHREKTRLLGDISGSCHKGSMQLGELNSLNKLRDALQTPASRSGSSILGQRSHSTSSSDKSMDNGRKSHSRMSADADRAPKDNMSLEILKLARQSSGSTGGRITPTQRTGLSPVSPYPKLTALRSPGHGSISPYSNLPDIPSSSPPLSTIPENIDSLPRSVMFDIEQLRRGLANNSPRADDVQVGLDPVKPPSAAVSNVPAVSAAVPKAKQSKLKATTIKPTTVSSKRTVKKDKTASVLQSVAKDNSLRASKNSSQETVKTSADLRSSTEKRAKLSAGKITVHRTNEVPSLLPSIFDNTTTSGEIAATSPRQILSQPKVFSQAESSTPVTLTSVASKPSRSNDNRKSDFVEEPQTNTNIKTDKENSKPVSKSAAKTQRSFKPTVIGKKSTEQKPKPVSKNAQPKNSNSSIKSSTNTQSKVISVADKDVPQQNSSSDNRKVDSSPILQTSDGNKSFENNSCSGNAASVIAQTPSSQSKPVETFSKEADVITSYAADSELTFNPSSNYGSAVVGNRPTGVGSRPTEVGNQPTEIGNRPTGVDNQPAGVGSRPTVVPESSQVKTISNRAASYKPLHLLLNSPLGSAHSNRKQLGTDEMFPEHFAEHGISQTGSGERDPASRGMHSEYQGPVIEDIFENFPRPLYEFAAVVAQDSANQKAVQAKKKKKKPNQGKGGDSRASSGVTRGAKNNNKKTAKAPKNRKNKKATDEAKMGEDVKQGDPETSALISGVDWHINADRFTNIDYILEHSDTDGGAMTGDDSDVEGLGNSHSATHRSLSLHDMSPRQRREELKNMLLLMRNSRHPGSFIPGDGSTASLLPETMQAIQEFVAAVPNEDELTKLFALDTVHVKDKQDGALQEESSDESIPDVSEVVLIEDSEDDIPAMVIDGKDTNSWLDSDSNDVELEEQIVEELVRCASTAMSDIIDEILTTPAPISLHDISAAHPLTPRITTPLMSVTSSATSLLHPKSPLTDSLLREINDQWRQTRQLVADQDETQISPTMLSTRRSSGPIPPVSVTPAMLKRSLSLKDDGIVWNHADISKHHHLSVGSNKTVISRSGTPDIRGADVDVPTHRSAQNEDSSQLLTWRKGNVLGKGAYGTVYCGLTNDGHLIAIKQIELNVHDWDKAEREYEGIQEEVELLKNLSHDNIVGFLGTSLDNHVVSIFMQFIPGGTISSLLSRFGAFEERVFQRFTLQIVDGVNYLHENDIIHRDIKGANIMLMLNGIIKLIDFGCAKRLCFNLSVSQSEILKSMKGTPYWMAPEVIKETGHGCKSDIWSIGCTVFEMATTSPPWSQMEPMAAMFAIGTNTKPVPELPDTFSDAARQFVSCCLQREPSLRSSARELLQSPFLSA